MKPLAKESSFYFSPYSFAYLEISFFFNGGQGLLTDIMMLVLRISV